MAELICVQHKLVLLLAVVLLWVSFTQIGNLKVSTKLEALMPEGAASVKTLQSAMEKAGSFASIQVLVRGEDQAKVQEVLFILEAVTRPLLWSESVQYFEDISVLERHKLLQLSVPELEKLETTLEEEILSSTARAFKEKTGIPISITLVGSGVEASSEITEETPFEEEQTIETEQRFISDDGLTQALVIWPKPGFEGLGAAKKMISDVASIIGALDLNAEDSGIHVGIAGRIRNKVAQYDAVIGDVGTGLGSSISLIVLLLLVYYRRLSAVFLIILPLVVGIIWTIGLTAVVVGGLNLITIFLALILFGLGIDFGIHNFSRYEELRAKGETHISALGEVIGHTGKASLIAAVTTASGFLSLMLTEFRAFREFGFIAGSGILLIYIAMYTVFPALLTFSERYINWQPRKKKQNFTNAFWGLGGKHSRKVFLCLLPMVVIAGYLAPQISFERNFKNLEAAKKADHQWAVTQSKNIFKGGHDRAVLVVENLDEVKAIEAYFEEYAKADTETPTIAKLTSVRNFVPDRTEQAERLEVIKRMWSRLEESGPVPESVEDKAKYLQIDTFGVDDLPPAMRRVFLGDESKPGYLMYIYNSVTMDDARLAAQFYDDVASFTVNGKTYHPASESFIFVEMLQLMKADAVKAVLLVGSITLLVVFMFVRSVSGTLVILLPTLVGLLFTVAVMAFSGIQLSIINMVIIPSLIGISVDNGIHIYERFREGGSSLTEVMATTGKASSITTLTTLLGFGGLITASMGGLRSMGLLAIIGFTMCLLLTWALLPALLKLKKPANPAPSTPYQLRTL
ncbi:MMPL family transporter [Kordiimonas sp. SCSIO 12603]|uniref:efflux RND transporter permease subunit n=1 Tax=Kordiimonas sp. SCSIO 12603 TaxID=2829596 RepID=UPI002103D5E6|nr:MMPL family transporter [Kordiimonas sp. SCSIO 12603]UTW59312.1 MMPL family transporter [Kordiimonas sp. SCSIO 12603]